MIIHSNRADVANNQFEKDGDFDAVITKFTVPRLDSNYTFWHRLGRVARQVSIVWADDFVEWKVAKGPDGQPMSDRDKIVLNFNETGVTIVLRFA
ncbi:MAG: hypothetical protein ABIY63_13355 [Fibrobacteria bacterium]